MAATAPKFASLLVLALACLPLAAQADDLAEIHQCVSAVALALSNGDTTQAMIPFSKTYADHDKLSSYFEALGGAYAVESQVDFTSEDLTKETATVTVRWALTLSTHENGFSKNRTSDVIIKFAHEGKHWRITALTPIDFFDPQKD